MTEATSLQIQPKILEIFDLSFQIWWSDLPNAPSFHTLYDSCRWAVPSQQQQQFLQSEQRKFATKMQPSSVLYIRTVPHQ